MVVCAPGRLAAEAPEREVRIARRRAAAEQKRVVAQTVSTVVGECKRERGRERRAPESGGCTLRCALGSSDKLHLALYFLDSLALQNVHAAASRRPHRTHILSTRMGTGHAATHSRSLSASTNERKKARGDALPLSRTNTNVHSSTRRRCGSRHLRLRLGKVD